MKAKDIDSIEELENYVESSQGDDKSYLTKEEKKQKEFKPSDKTETVRFIPFDPEKENSSNRFFDKAYFHDVKVGDYKSKVYCNKNDGLPCPLCKKAEKILSKQFPKGDPKGKENFKLGKSWEANEYHIFKLISKGALGHGVKFWRTRTPFSGTSILHKILEGNKQFVRNNSKSEEKIEYISLTNGCDMEISSTQKTLPQNPRIKYWEVSSILPYSMAPTSILEDSKMQSILEEGKDINWKLIFNKFEIKDVITAEQYLELCAKGEAPYWDKDNKTFAFPNHPELSALYEKVRAERASSYNKDENGEDDSIDSIEDIEKKYSGVVDNKKGIEDMPEEDDDDDYYDDEDDDDLPF